MTRPIDADALKREQMKAFNCENATKYGNKDAKQQGHSYSTIMLYEVSDIIEDTIDNAPTVPLPNFKEGYKQAILDGKTNFSRPKGEWITHQTGMLLWGQCNQCNAQVGTIGMNFCPNCGADMREADDE